MAVAQAKKQLRSKIKAALAGVSGDSVLLQSNVPLFSPWRGYAG
jgi:hypothetical protein